MIRWITLILFSFIIAPVTASNITYGHDNVITLYGNFYDGQIYFRPRVNGEKTVTFEGIKWSDTDIPVTFNATDGTIAVCPAKIPVVFFRQKSEAVCTVSYRSNNSPKKCRVTLRFEDLDCRIKPGKINHAMLNDHFDNALKMFIHYSINTYTPHEWTDGRVPPSVFNPTSTMEQIAEDWVALAEEAGFRSIVFVTKHHDGFCLWDSRATDYDIASSPAAGGDLVRAVVDACNRRKIKYGFYFSLWDRNFNNGEQRSQRKFKITPDFLNFTFEQLTELLDGRYGSPSDLWLDGPGFVNKGKRDQWQAEKIYDLVKTLHPKTMVAHNTCISPDRKPLEIAPPFKQRTKGFHITLFPSDVRSFDPHVPRPDDELWYKRKGSDGKELYYMPFLGTVPLRGPDTRSGGGWYWHNKSDNANMRSFGYSDWMFSRLSSGHNMVLINYSPARDGKIPPLYKTYSMKLKERLGQLNSDRFKPFPRNLLVFGQDTVKASSESVAKDGTRCPPQGIVDLDFNQTDIGKNKLEVYNPSKFGRWRSKPEEKQSWVEIQLQKPVTMNFLRIKQGFDSYKVTEVPYEDSSNNQTGDWAKGGTAKTWSPDDSGNILSIKIELFNGKLRQASQTIEKMEKNWEYHNVVFEKDYTVDRVMVTIESKYNKKASVSIQEILLYRKY